MRRAIVSVVTLTVLAILMLTPALAASPVLHASATLIDSTGKTVGVVRLTERPNGSVLVTVHVSGLTPGPHGIHVHATGTCDPLSNFLSAGGHFNPDDNLHGSHAGDLGNINASWSGRANMARVVIQFTLSPGSHSLFDANGSALVIHAGPDDLMTDPTGNSGARVACGVIKPR